MAIAEQTGDEYGRRWRPATSHRVLRTRRTTGPTRSIPRSVGPVPTERPAVAGSPAAEAVLEVRDLKTYFFTYDGVVRALEGINLTARRGQTTGVVGETGCGKSVTAFSVTRLVSHPGLVISGKILYRGANLLWGLEREAKFKRRRDGRIKVVQNFRRTREAAERLAAIRGRRIAMIFQEPMQAMNPIFSISNQLGETILLHRGLEVVEGMLRADAQWPGLALLPQQAELDFLAEPGAAAAGTGGAPEGSARDRGRSSAEAIRAAIDALVAATTTDDEQLRAFSERFGEVVGVPTLGTEAFYIVRTTHAGDPSRHRRILRSLRRVPLSSLQRSYLLHLRRTYAVKTKLDQLSMKEMKSGQSASFERRRLRFMLTMENLRTLHFRLWGIRNRIGRPLKDEVFWRTVRLLEGVKIANPAQVARMYPHELSGGMLQRVMIAMALSTEPDVLLADEPTTALDVTIQAQILELMRDLRERIGTAVLLITHDLGVVAEVCDHVNVMYAGVVVEAAPAKELFRRPLHPYSQGLLSSIPRFDQPDRELQTIPGSVPNLVRPPPGCRFHPRCPYAMPVCKELRPENLMVGPEHMVACHLYAPNTVDASGTPAPAAEPASPPAPPAPGGAEAPPLRS